MLIKFDNSASRESVASWVGKGGASQAATKITTQTPENSKQNISRAIDPSFSGAYSQGWIGSSRSKASPRVRRSSKQGAPSTMRFLPRWRNGQRSFPGTISGACSATCQGGFTNAQCRIESSRAPIWREKNAMFRTDASWLSFGRVVKKKEYYKKKRKI